MLRDGFGNASRNIETPLVKERKGIGKTVIFNIL